jgi:hypothetical protein
MISIFKNSNYLFLIQQGTSFLALMEEHTLRAQKYWGEYLDTKFRMEESMKKSV